MPVYQYKQGDRPLDGYTIDYALGRGGFGEVYFAHSDAGREVALKAIQNHEETELRGIGHCMNLKSQHLVMIFDVKQGDDGTPWVIMEYVAGPSLRELLDDAPEGLGEEKAIYFMRELCQGIQYLHSAGVVHRDLKPHNVIFEDGVVKVGDYSLSKAITHSHRSGHTTTVGSVHYMAPEISMGRYDKTVDIYALGVIFYEMLTGGPPYTGESIGEVLMKHLNADLDVSDLKEPYASVVARAMHRDPEKRFQSVDELVEAVTGDSTEKLSPPASLSMIGNPDRRGQLKVEPVSVSQISETITPHSATTDTKPKHQKAAGNQGKNWCRSNKQPRGQVSQPHSRRRELGSHPVDDRSKAADLISRLLLTIGATCVLVGVCIPFESNNSFGSGYWMPIHSLPLMMWTWVFSIVCSVVWTIGLPESKRGIRWSIASRLISMLPAALGTIIVCANARHDEVDHYAMIFGGVIFSLAVFDWRHFARASRRSRVLPLRTASVGIATTAVPLMTGNPNVPVFFAAAAGMSAAVTLQLVAPWYQTTNVQPHYEVNQATRAANLKRSGDQERSIEAPEPVLNEVVR